MSIPQQANVEVSKQSVHYWASSPFLSATIRLQLARCHQDQYDWLDSEFPNLRGCQSWLVTQRGAQEVHLLLDYVRVFAPYLQHQGLLAELVDWCKAGLHASETLQQSSGWLLDRALWLYHTFKDRCSCAASCTINKEKLAAYVT